MLISLDPHQLIQRQRARLTPAADGEFLLADGPGAGLQLIEWRHADLARAALRLRVVLRPLGAGADFLLLGADRSLLARFGRDGTLHVPPDAPVQQASCTANATGGWQLDLQFRNFAPSLLLALGQPGIRHAGSGQAHFALRDLQVEVVERRWLPTPEDSLVVLETGTEPGEDKAWLPFHAGLRTIRCEPKDEPGRAALATLPPGDDPVLLPYALSNRNGPGKLNTTRDPAHSSVLDPDPRRLKPFAAAADFEVTNTARIQLARFDTLSRQLGLPRPHLLRMRAGGAEFDGLRGCGDLLDSVLGVEVQVHFQPLYRKQKLIGDVIDLLDGHGLALRHLQPRRTATTAHEMVATTACFTRRDVDAAALPKIAFIEEVWGVSFPR
jgi:hypothetical protein